MASVTLQTAEIADWESFHDQCCDVFGFPSFYGRNMDAWIDCMSCLTEDDGMTRFSLVDGEQLHLHIPDFELFSERLPEICKALIDSTAFVNRRYVEAKETPRLGLILE